ncbi:MAG: hypothetical protein AAGA93_02460 [Actinomycetota bacterium]
MASAPPPTSSSPESAAVDWRVVEDAGSADEFHRRQPEQDTAHELWVRELLRPALVLGSTQPDELIVADRAEADGIEVCRRRSGGGLVYLDPATDCWIDAIVPAGSPLWRDDIGQAFHWIGEAWGRLLTDRLGPAGPALVHRPTPHRGRPMRPLWCFAELGHGEVTVGAAKVVGLSQRRTRRWIRLQSLVLGGWPGRQLRPYIDADVARTLAARDRRPGGDPANADELGPIIDPALVRAGPPAGLRLPEPSELAADFLRRTTGGG